MRRRRRDSAAALMFQLALTAVATLALMLVLLPAHNLQAAAAAPESGLKFDPDTNSYSGLTFTFDPRLDKRVEWLHFEHWLSLLQHSSGLLYEALNGRAHLAEVRVLIPYKWRQLEWPVLHKPGVPIMTNRRIRYADSDVIVGFEDPNYKETPFAVQHDECARQGLNIHMPISFLLEQQSQPLEPKLKARQFVREFAAHRYGIFKESGFRGDPMYPPFTSLAGFSGRQAAGRLLNRTTTPTGADYHQHQHQHQHHHHHQQQVASALVMSDATMLANSSSKESQLDNWSSPATSIRGFYENWSECSFDTLASSGLPSAQAASCAPYLAKAGSHQPQQQQQQPASEANGEQQRQASSLPLGTPTTFNLMSSDPFSYGDLSSSQGGTSRLASARLASSAQPLEWRDLAEAAKWRFCGDNFVPSVEPAPSSGQRRQQQQQGTSAIANDLSGSQELLRQPLTRPPSFVHNQLAANKQNIMCAERSALDVIKASEDFKRTPFSPSTFNRLPAPTFRFLQEMPARLILCVEYSAHLFQSRRLDHGILEAAIAKLLALDLLPESELALVLFGQQHATRGAFKRLDSSLEARLTLYSPPIDPFDEPPRLYTEQELSALGVGVGANGGQSQSSQAKLVKGTSSFARLLAEVVSLQQRGQSYDDVGADIVIITSGLFVEDESKIDELLRAHFKQDQLQLQLIIYPSAMLFDTRSRDNGAYVSLDALEAEAIIRNRVNKLLLIQRLTGAKIHLVREHLDANGDVKMSTLVQFYQIFEHISRGHSWDQTHALTMVGQQAVEARVQANGSSKLSFQFELDQSVGHELIAAFIDPKQHHQQQSAKSSGKRFAIRNLQLRAPNGQLVCSDSQPWSSEPPPPPSAGSPANLRMASFADGGAQADSSQDQLAASPPGQQGDDPMLLADSAQSAAITIGAGSSQAESPESTLFPHRTQMGLAGFHLKAAHLAQLNASNRLAGVWTLTATSDEPIATAGLAMVRVNPTGDTLTANCWVQSYFEPSEEGGALKAVKVFAQTKAGAQLGPVQEVQARVEVQDEMGNIVQNVNMLDDGLGAPDMTRGDGIHSQFVQRAHRPGYYKVAVEISASSQAHFQQQHKTSAGAQSQQTAQSGSSGRDNVCCGSLVPPTTAGQLQVDTRYLSRQLYCGTFYVDANNKLGQQRPPRVTNLTVANVDQENRRVTIRWFEPSVDISVHHGAAMSAIGAKLQASSSGDDEAILVGSSPQESGETQRTSRHVADEREEDPATGELPDLGAGFGSSQTGQPSQQQTSRSSSSAQQLSVGRALLLSDRAPLSSRYEIKLFSDRDAVKRAFDARQEVGFKFNEWNVEGAFPNASAYGGLKEVTLRIPFGREGIYYIAMKVYNNLGVGSQLSNIASFWIRNNLTTDEAESLYGQASTIDAEGNIYDRNGELIQRAGTGGQLSYSSLLRNSHGSLDGISILVFVSVAAFVFSIVCVALVACLASSARKSLGQSKNKKTSGNKADDKKLAATAAAGATSAGSAITGITGSGSSSLVSSGCGSSQQSEVASSAGDSQGGHDVDINKLALVGDELTAACGYGNILIQQQQQQQQQQRQRQQYQHQFQQQQQLANDNNNQFNNQYQQQQLADYQRQFGATSPTNTTTMMMETVSSKQSQWLQHTMINGFAYATVNPGALGLPTEAPSGGSIASDCATTNPMSPVQSWPADILLSHYDKVKQARERNEAPPVMRIETLEHQGPFTDQGLPTLDELQQQQASSYFNQQLQQQLSSVLKKKQRLVNADSNSSCEQPALGSSPALDGVTDHQQQQQHQRDAGLCALEPTYGQFGDHQMAPPPQYVYCGENGLSRHHQDPSIYSQVTNLQQVSSGQPADQIAGYYANQWPSANNATNSIYSADQYQQQQLQPAPRDFAGSDQTNSAISEV